MDDDRQLPHRPTPTPRAGIPVGRAAFLGVVATGLAGIGLAPLVRRPVEGAVGDAAGVLPSAVRSLAPSNGWRIYTVASPMPRFDPATYRLRITGLVERPQTLTWDEIAALPTVSQVSTFHCVTGWTVEDVHWRGVRGRALLDLVRPLPTARYATLSSMERPYVDQVTVAQLRLPDVLLAHWQDGRPLTRAHGAPLRLVIPDMYGYKNVKWVEEIRFVDRFQPGFWEQRGYDVDAWVGRSNGA
jgi:DMSO/TMAO reductase YedYZ molybdopterin-dependent catalytic subunit